MKQILRIFILTAMVSTVWGQTTGKISGTVQADDGTPLAGADVVVVGTGSGSSSDSDGSFQILNVPAGAYNVKATYIGYTSQEHFLMLMVLNVDLILKHLELLDLHFVMML